MNEFVRHYLETALWSSTDESTPEGGEPMDKNYTVEDMAPETIAKAKADCERFQALAGEMLANALDSGECGWSPDDHTARSAHDFWLTRNGHGAGFWDGDWPVNGDNLTALVGHGTDFPEVDLYVGDNGLIYSS